MKNIFIRSILANPVVGIEIKLLAWVRSKRDQKNYLFFDIEDSTGSIQIVIDKRLNTQLYDESSHIKEEASILVKGITQNDKKGNLEILASEVKLIGDVTLNLDPRPREDFDILGINYTNYILDNRHLFIRNRTFIEIMIFRHVLMKIIHKWFSQQGFIEVFSPVFTQIPLYEDDTAFCVDYFGTKTFLTQCVAFHLESAVQALEKVYSIGPSFRAEKSKSRRHLAEYWHLKGEIAFTDLVEMMEFAEKMIYEISTEALLYLRDQSDFIKLKEATPPAIGSLPFPRITYSNACDYLNSKGQKKVWGTSLSDGDIKILSTIFSGPYWITGMPAKIEPFIYELDPNNQEITKTADLIASEGYGELLGVAEKIWLYDTLKNRIMESGKGHDNRYSWYLDLRNYGSVPHSGFGLGIERLIMWLLKLNHVRDAIPFPRLPDRFPSP